VDKDDLPQDHYYVNFLLKGPLKDQFHQIILYVPILALFIEWSFL